jgi:hypothetical protein
VNRAVIPLVSDLGWGEGYLEAALRALTGVPEQVPPLHLMGVSGRPQPKSCASAASRRTRNFSSGNHSRKVGSSRLYLAMTTVVQELLSLGKSRSAAMRTSSLGRSPRIIGQ